MKHSYCKEINLVFCSHNRSQQDSLFHNFILVKNLHVTDRLTVHHQESQHCVHSNRSLSLHRAFRKVI